MSEKDRTVGKWVALALISLLVSLSAISLPAGPAVAADGDPLINEFVFNHDGTDTHEFIEVFGAPDTDYSAYTLLEIEGDSSGAGVVDGVFPVGTTDGNGFWTTGFLNNEIENGTVTLLLVEGFTGSLGDDLDADNDGVLDTMPWTRIVDDVAVHDGGSSDHTYAAVTLTRGFDGVSYTPGGASRIPNGTDTDAVADWMRNDFHGAGLPGFTGTPEPGEALNTPGAVNEEAVPSGPGITPIHDIQYTEDPSGDSPYVGQTVTTRGVVTAFFYDGRNRRFFIQDGTGPWSGLFLYNPDGFLNVGDLVEVTGEVSEYYGLTEIAFGEATVLSSGNPLPDPAVLPTGEVSQEQWESVLVRVENVTVTEPDLGYGEWLVDDGSGGVRVDDLGTYSYAPNAGDLLDFVQGPLYYSYGHFKIEPRDDGDIGIAPPLVSICEIQGSGFTSPYEGQTVRTQGVVFADFDQTSKRGFFIQFENCDGDPATSDGIFVYKRNRDDVVSVGDLVEVRGTVQEYYDLTEISTYVSNITVLSEGNPLPEPVDLNPPFDDDAARAYLESLEGMYVKMDDATVVGPTSRYDETWVVRSDLGLDRVFQDDPAGTGEVVGVDDSGLFEITPEAKVGDRVLGLLGPLDYTYGAYKMQLVAEPTLLPAPDPPKYGDVDGDGDVDLDDLAVIHQHLGETVPPAPESADLNGDGRITGRDIAAFLRLLRQVWVKPMEFTVATFNLENLFDTVDEPEKDDPVLSAEDYELKLDKLAEAIHDELGEPTIIGVQEAENLTVLADLAARPEIEAEYGAVLVDGPDGRGIDVGLLYRTDRVTVLGYEARQGCTTLVDGFGPDGNRDPRNPVNEITCDSDGDGVLDGNRLFSRPPLVVHLQVRYAIPRWGSAQPHTWRHRRSQELWVIVSHFKSKGGDTPEVEYTLPRRIEQAQFVAGLVQEIQAADPKAAIIVLGDLNDYLDSEPLTVLTSAGLEDLLLDVGKPERYTYIYQGRSGVLDHLLITPNLRRGFVGVTPLHINADYPNVYADVADTARRSSDHDPVVARFRIKR
ncbi:MAG TPA: hypothetical protein G4O00_05765 [Thermoflexia bacterium]|nr:hypothetical protein [Thermoflexia bacterium]